MSSEELLSSVRHALEVGNKVAARTLLVQMVKSGQANGETWHLMEQVVDDPAQKADCARRAAAAGWVEPKPAPKVEPAAAPPSAPSVVASVPIQSTTLATPSRLASISAPTVASEPAPQLIIQQAKPRKHAGRIVGIVVGVLLIAALAGGVFLQRRNSSQTAVSNAASTVPAGAATSEATASTTPSLAAVDLEPLLIQPNDLPTGLQPGQVSDIEPGAFRTLPPATKRIFQQVEQAGAVKGTIAVFLYDDLVVAKEAYTIAAPKLGDPKIRTDVGNTARISVLNPLGGTTVPLITVVFRRCNAVVSFVFTTREESAAIAYAKRLDKRLQTAVCP